MENGRFDHLINLPSFFFKREEVGVFLSDTFGIVCLNICNFFLFHIPHERIDENELNAILE